MAEIKNMATGVAHQGDTFDEIARRVWGDRVYVRVGSRIGDGVALGEITRKLPKRYGDDAYETLAQVVLYWDGDSPMPLRDEPPAEPPARELGVLQ